MARPLQAPVEGLAFNVMSPMVVPAYRNERARAANAMFIRLQVRRAVQRLGIQNPTIFVTVPTAWDVASTMERRALVFNRSDKHSAFVEAHQPSIESLENDLLRRADRVIYASRALMTTEEPLVGDRGVFLDHGVDLALFRHRGSDEEPPDLAVIPHPRVGFFGGLDEQTVDISLFDRLASALPDVQIVLVGNATVNMSSLERHPNVHWLGQRPYEEIPRYGSGFDVAVMPWQHNEWIAACNPIKLKEYLALGLPVVSTDFPELHRYSRHVTIARDPDDFVASVAARLQDRGPGTAETRRAAVGNADWDDRARELSDLIDALPVD
jgi:glycosyltransferase involved in cell wall biosynthesis